MYVTYENLFACIETIISAMMLAIVLIQYIDNKK